MGRPRARWRPSDGDCSSMSRKRPSSGGRTRTYDTRIMIRLRAFRRVAGHGSAAGRDRRRPSEGRAPRPIRRPVCARKSISRRHSAGVSSSRRRNSSAVSAFAVPSSSSGSRSIAVGTRTPVAGFVRSSPSSTAVCSSAFPLVIAGPFTSRRDANDFLTAAFEPVPRVFRAVLGAPVEPVDARRWDADRRQRPVAEPDSVESAVARQTRR
jgi:hypothetical protein